MRLIDRLRCKMGKHQHNLGDIGCISIESDDYFFVRKCRICGNIEVDAINKAALERYAEHVHKEMMKDATD